MTGLKKSKAWKDQTFYDDKRGAIVLRYLAGELEGREYAVDAATLRRGEPGMKKYT